MILILIKLARKPNGSHGCVTCCFSASSGEIKSTNLKTFPHCRFLIKIQKTESNISNQKNTNGAVYELLCQSGSLCQQKRKNIKK